MVLCPVRVISRETSCGGGKQDPPLSSSVPLVVYKYMYKNKNKVQTPKK